MEYSNLWFISIETIDDATDFTNWLEGKMVKCKDTMEFSDWLHAYKTFPLEILLDGTHYKFKDARSANIFHHGFEAAMRLRYKI